LAPVSESCGAAPRRRRDQDAGVASVLRVERRILQLEFADGVETQLRVLTVVGAGVGIRRAVEHDVVHTVAQAVDHETGRAVEREPESGVVGRDTGQRLQQGREVASVQAQLADLRVGDRVRLLARPHLDHGRFRDDVHRLGQGADFDLDRAEIEDLTGIEHEAAPFDRLESRELGPHGVAPAEQGHKTEESVRT
jgi:hypothetical protein